MVIYKVKARKLKNLNITVKTSAKLSNEAMESPALTIFNEMVEPSFSVIKTLSRPLCTT